MFIQYIQYFNTVTPIKTIPIGTERPFLVSLHTHLKFNRYSIYDNGKQSGRTVR